MGILFLILEEMFRSKPPSPARPPLIVEWSYALYAYPLLWSWANWVIGFSFIFGALSWVMNVEQGFSFKKAGFRRLAHEAAKYLGWVLVAALGVVAAATFLQGCMTGMLGLLGIIGGPWSNGIFIPIGLLMMFLGMVYAVIFTPDIFYP